MQLPFVKSALQSRTVWTDIGTIGAGLATLYGWYDGIDTSPFELIGALGAIAGGFAGIYCRIKARTIIVPFLNLKLKRTAQMPDATPPASSTASTIQALAAALEGPLGAGIGSYLAGKLTPAQKTQYAALGTDIAIAMTALAAIASGVAGALNSSAAAQGT